MDQDRRKAWGFCLFGDDIRPEVGGKFSLMGLYQRDLIFQGSFPFVAAKFVILIMYYELTGALTSDIVFKVYFMGMNEPVAELTILRKDIPFSESEPPKLQKEDSEENSERIFHAMIPIVLSPFVFEQPGRLRIRAHYSDGAVLRLGGLNINARSLDIPKVDLGDRTKTEAPS